MARHSSGRSNYRLSTPLIIVVIAVILIVAVVLWLLNRSGDDDTQARDNAQECLQGDLSLPVGGDAELVREVVAGYNSSTPTSRDFCVTAEAAADGAPAATYLFAGTRTQAWEAFAGTGAVAAASADAWPQVASLPAGIATTSPTLDTLDEITLPVASDPGLAGAVADALSDNPEAAVAALSRDREIDAATAAQAPAFAASATTEIPEGYTFTALDGAGVPVWAIATNAAEGISEDQARAGADFARDAAATLTGDGAVLAPARAGTNPDTLESLLTPDSSDEATAADPGAVEESAAPAGPADTLITLDTSVNMNAVVDGTQESYHTVVTRALADLARETGGQGHQVALNNYSSPLNTGVSRAWRSNVGFPDDSAGADAAGSVVRLGTGGFPLTRSSVIAATQIASEQAAATGQPVRIVLVTSGTAGNYIDADFLFSLNAAASDDVRLHVVHVGHGAVDELLASWAREHGGSAEAATTVESVDQALRTAFGL